MRYFWRKLFLYAKLPEMKLFWFFSPFLIILFCLNVFYLPEIWIFASAAILLILGAIILVSSLRLARSNLEIKIERNELTSIISNLNDGVIAYDPNFKILIFNQAAERIFNLSSQKIIGQYLSPERSREPYFKLISQVIFPSLAPTIIRHSVPGAYPQIVDISFDEPKVELRVITNKIIDPKSQLLGFVKLINDRTREIGLIKQKTEFIGIASHQLRTPLTGIHWAIESLSKQPLTEEQKELTNAALGAVIKLLKIVNDLLDVSKIEEGRFGYQFENVNIISFIENIIKETKGLIGESGIKIYFQKPADSSIIISMDPQKLSMVFSGLLDNAIRYNVQKGEVIVTVERLENQPYLKISVKDTGIGIPSDEMNKLFTKFFRSENVKKFYPDGSGLGLYIVKNIIKRHGGEIWLESEINRGTTFYFTLPIDSKLIPVREMAYGEE
ncbi:hypothetical protein COS61_02200 [Candidatus Wolfebacteria bacterium CG03_land_8_20_14_0_80_40_12]|uniref:histidine kinase n=1 Tax=Candidatus Wolfebacteria bacterium CG03_land_8_20_14_0_80_40_12 TaxID=1975069 RepID=A0A2M7B594_9BACT|nr:MAG: hypothetical protein COS61_02200 [Candidatus Wolfebacteria bacterium CG03_land_8_20_14_0_80_40_12]